MVYPFCGNCSKVYSSVSSRKEREKKKGHWSEYNIDPDISFNEETKSFHWQTAGCAVTAKYKYNIIKQLLPWSFWYICWISRRFTYWY